MATKAIDGGTARRDNRGGTAKRRIRKVFGNIHEVVQMPNLIEVQRESYEQFLRSDRETGYVSGLEKTLRSVFPIRDFAGTAELDFDQVRHLHDFVDVAEHLADAPLGGAALDRSGSHVAFASSAEKMDAG